jgi:transposase-like protein
MPNDEIRQTRRNYTPQEKFMIAWESFREDVTIDAVCRKYGVHSTQVTEWRKKIREEGHKIFLDQRNIKNRALVNGFKPGESPEELKRIIGEYATQVEILKKVQGLLR